MPFCVIVIYSHMQIHIYIYTQHHNDTINKQMSEDFFINICTSHFIARVRKYFDPHSYGRQRCVFLVFLMLNRRPRGPLCWVMTFFTASYQHLLWTPTHQGPNGPFGLMWLSLPHLVYNSVRSLTVTV